jgi:hypothetical protein
VKWRDEVERVHRVSNMLASGHTNLCDRYRSRAAMLDILILMLSSWLVAVVFIEPRIRTKLTPLGLDPQTWVGLLGIFTFLLTVFQLSVNWKGRSDAHRRSLDMYVNVKRECRYLLDSERELDFENCKGVMARYDLAATVGTPLSEKEFLYQKRHHVQKLAISRRLGTHPGTSIAMLRVKMWWKDNFESN